MLEHQYGPFIRQSKYREAFQTAIEVLEGVEHSSRGQDQFYLFLHLLVVQLFQEIELLSQRLEKLNSTTGNN